MTPCLALIVLPPKIRLEGILCSTNKTSSDRDDGSLYVDKM